MTEQNPDKYTRREKNFLRDTEESIDTEVLERIPFDYPETGTEVEYTTDEFTFVCPWTSLPDFGRIRITYVPREVLNELKSLKYYLLSFRSVGILQEHVVCRILDDLAALLEPQSIKVEGWFRDRGGLRTYVKREWERD